MDRVMNGMLNNFGELPEDIKKIDTSLDNISNEEMTENLERLHTDRYFKMMDSLDTLSEDAEIMKLEKELHRRSVDEIIARENDNVYEVIWKDSTVVGGKQRFYALDKKEAILRAKHESRYGSDYKVILIGKASEFKLVSNEGKVPDVTKDNQETVIKKLIEGFIFVGRYQDVNSSCKVYANPETREVKEIETFDNGNKTERSYYYTKEEDYTEDYYTEEINNKLRDLFPAEYEGPEESLVKNLLSGSGRLYEEDYTEEPDFDAGEEAVVDEPTEEPVAPTEEEAPEAKKDEAPKLKKEYLGKTEDTHYYIIANETDEGQAEDLQIVDQGGIKKYSAKDNNLDITDVVGFIIKAIEEVEIAQIERGIFMKYILPKLTEEEKPEVEEEPAGTEEEEVKAEEPEEEEEVEESKVIKEDNKDLLDKVDHALNDLEDDMIHILWKKYVEQEQELDINLLKEQLVNVAEADEDVLKEIAKDLGINESKVNEEIKISDIKVKELKNIGLVLSAKTSKGDYSQFYNTQDVTSSTYVDNVEQAKDRFITFYNKFEGKVPDVTKDNQETVIKKLTEVELKVFTGSDEMAFTGVEDSEDEPALIGEVKVTNWPEDLSDQDDMTTVIVDKNGIQIIGQDGWLQFNCTYEQAKQTVERMPSVIDFRVYHNMGWKAFNFENIKECEKSDKKKRIKKVKVKEGKVPDVTKDNPETAIKKLLEMEVEDGLNVFDVYLVDNGTMDTVISVNGREFRFDADFAGFWRDEDGEMSEEGLKELALDALSNLEEDEYSELLVSCKDVGQINKGEFKVREGSGEDVPFEKEVYEIEYELNGKKKKMRVIAFDEVEAKKMTPEDPGAKVLNVKKVAIGAKAVEGKVPDVTKDNQETVIKKLTEKGNKMDKNTKYVLKVDQPDHSTDIIKEFSASMSLDQVKKEINSLLAVEEKWPKEIGEGSVVYLETPEGKALAWEGDENWVDYTGSMGVKNKQENTVERDKAYKEQKALRVKGRELYTKGYLLRGEDGAKLRAEGNKLIDQADEIWEPYVESEEHIGERKIKEDKLNLNIKMLILQGLLRGQNEDEIRRNLKSHRYDEEEYDQLVSNLMLKMKGASKEIIQKELDANEIERLKNPFYDEEVIADVPDEIENKFGSFHNYTEEEASRILKELEKVEKSKNIKMAIRVSNKWCDTIGSDDYSGEAVGPFYAGEGEDKGLWGYEGGMLSEEEVFDNMKTMIEDTKIYISLLNESKLKKLTEKGDKMGTRKISAGILRNFKQKIAKETYNKSYEELDYDEILDLSPEIGQFLDSYQGSSRNKGNFCLSYESQGHNVWSFCFDSKEEANEFLNEYEKNKEDKGIPSLENLKTGEKLVMSDAEWEEDTSVAEDDFRTKKGKSDYNADLLKDNGDFEIKKENYHNKATNADFVRFSIIGKKSGREYCPMALNWGIEELPNQKKRLAAELAALKQQKEKRIKEDKSINILRDLLHLND